MKVVFVHLNIVVNQQFQMQILYEPELKSEPAVII